MSDKVWRMRVPEVKNEKNRTHMFYLFLVRPQNGLSRHYFSCVHYNVVKLKFEYTTMKWKT